jgi:hypothetical protein
LVDLEHADTLVAIKGAFAPSINPTSSKWVFGKWSPEDGNNNVLSMIELSLPDSIRALLPGVSFVKYEWAPDFRSLVAYGHPRTEGRVGVWIIPMDLSPPTVVTFNELLVDYEFAWSPSGRWLAIVGPPDSADYETNSGFLLLHDTQTGSQYSPADSIQSSLYDPPIWTADSSVACVDIFRGGYFEVLICLPADVEP